MEPSEPITDPSGLPADMDADRRGRMAALALGGLQVAFLVWTRLVQPPLYVDDAFIHFRNARNLVEGFGLVYNPGAWVLGTTSPVYAALLGDLHWLTRIELPALARGVNFLIDAGIVWLSLALLRRVGMPLPLRHATVLSCSAEAWGMFFSAGGMEMGLLVLVLLGVFESLWRGRWLAAGLLLGIAGWVRPEGALIWVVAAAALAHERRMRDLRRTAIVGGAVALAFVVCLTATYGTFIPLSVTAKLSAPWFATGQGMGGMEFFVRLGSLLPINGVTGYYPPRASETDLLLDNLAALAVLGMAIWGARRIGRGGHAAEGWALAGFFALYYLFYAVGNPQLFFWYYTPFLWAGLMLLGCGVWAAADAGWDAVCRRRPHRTWRRGEARRAVAAVYLVLAMTTAAVNGNHWNYGGAGALRGLAFRHRGFDATTREARYLRAAGALNARIDGDRHVRVGCTEIGIFGYYFEGIILDVYGLVSPEALAVEAAGARDGLPEDSRHFPIDVLMLERPEMVMTDEKYLPRRSASFDALYRKADEAGLDLSIFVRNDRKDLMLDANRSKQ